MKILIVQDLDLDCAIDLTQAPGLSAYNRAERKMYHLSKELAGIVLPADTYGTHLKDGRTIDEKLEEENFKAAGEVLSEVWSNLVIDDHPVTCEYVSQKPPEYISGFTVSASYKSRHLIETQYMTVALKCEDVMCCAPPKTMVSKFFPQLGSLLDMGTSQFGELTPEFIAGLCPEEVRAGFGCVMYELQRENSRGEKYEVYYEFDLRHKPWVLRRFNGPNRTNLVHEKQIASKGIP